MPGGIADRRRGRKHQERGQEERRRLHASQAQDQTQSTGDTNNLFQKQWSNKAVTIGGLHKNYCYKWVEMLMYLFLVGWAG